jgi:hypothetical protein
LWLSIALLGFTLGTGEFPSHHWAVRIIRTASSTAVIYYTVPVAVVEVITGLRINNPFRIVKTHIPRMWIGRYGTTIRIYIVTYRLPEGEAAISLLSCNILFQVEKLGVEPLWYHFYCPPSGDTQYTAIFIMHLSSKYFAANKAYYYNCYKFSH